MADFAQWKATKQILTRYSIRSEDYSEIFVDCNNRFVLISIPSADG